MEQKEFQIKNYEQYTFRLKKINAIEIFALKTQLRFTNVDDTTNVINSIFERIEVKAGNTWLPVKLKDNDVYTPDVLEEDVEFVSSLMNKFIEMVNEVFQKSRELK